MTSVYNFTRLVTGKVTSSIQRKGLLRTLKSCAAEMEEIRFDRKCGVDTLENGCDYTVPAAQAQSVHMNIQYSPTKIRTAQQIFRNLPIRYEDFVFLDFGSGKGRTLLLASDHPFRRIVGVEFSPELHAIAENNIRVYHNRGRMCQVVQSCCCDATTYPLPPDDLVLFLFNPFKYPVMANLLDNVWHSLKTHPRQIYIVYNNPVCRDLMAQCAFLETVQDNELYAIYRAVGPSRQAMALE